MDSRSKPPNSFATWQDVPSEIAAPPTSNAGVKRVGRTAAVNGAGMAGLMAACCLRHSFDVVYVFDKDSAELSVASKTTIGKVIGHFPSRQPACSPPFHLSLFFCLSSNRCCLCILLEIYTLKLGSARTWIFWSILRHASRLLFLSHAPASPLQVPGQDGSGRSIRPGVPQMQQLHMMQIGGANAVEAQCPGFKSLVRQLGGVEVNFLRDNKGV